MIIYLDTSAALRAVVEVGTSPDIEDAIATAETILSSRLALVESARVFHRLRLEAKHTGRQIDELERTIEELWSRSEIWELSKKICGAASKLAPTRSLRTLDALHLATFQSARRRIPSIQLVTADDRLRQASESL